MSIPNRALDLAAKWFDEQTVQRIFVPLIADWQREWMDAPAARRPLVSLRGGCAFLCAALISSPAVARTPVPASVTNRIAVRITTVVGIVSVLLFIPISLSVRMPDRQWPLLLLILPSTLTMAFPFAMTAAVDAIRRYDRVPPQVERAALLKLCAFSVIFMLIFGGWLVPASSYAWRSATSPDRDSAPLRLVQELNTAQLVIDPARATVFAPGTALASRSAAIRRTLNQRAAMMTMPLVLLWMRWRSLNQSSRRWYSPLPASAATVAVIATFGACWSTGAQIELRHIVPASLAVWLPVGAFAVWGFTGPYLRRQLLARVCM